MAGKQGEKRDAGARGLTQFGQVLKRLAGHVMEATEDYDLPQLQGRAKALADMAKSAQTLSDIQSGEMTIGGRDDAMDAVGEQQLRDELRRRLDALEAEIEAGCDPRKAGTEGA